MTCWARTVAFERHPRRLAGTVAEAWHVERGFLAALPRPLPSTDQHVEARVSKDGFIRVGNVDYSVPPGHAGRRVQLHASPSEVVAFLDGEELARHSAATCPPTWFSTPSMSARCGSNAKRNDASRPQTSRCRP